MVNYFSSKLRSIFDRSCSFRGQCILCSEKAQQTLDICKPCEVELPFLGPRCQRCALPLNQLNEQYCGQCLHSPPPFKRTEAIWFYQPPIAQLITSFKYESRLSYGKTLAKMGSTSLVGAYKQKILPSIICPIPLHWQRRFKRGFNQSEIIASVFSSQLKIPLDHLLVRSQATPHQLGLKAKQRRQNLSNAFAVTGEVTGKTIAVVDDVMTTGATATAASRCLLDAGAAEVHIWCLARTPH
jgi:ComF family protein